MLIQKLFQPIVLGLDCDTFTARCWEECWKNLDIGHCFCYSLYSIFAFSFCSITFFIFWIYFCAEQNDAYQKFEFFRRLMFLIFNLTLCNIQQKNQLLYKYFPPWTLKWFQIGKGLFLWYLLKFSWSFLLLFNYVH